MVSSGLRRGLKTINVRVIVYEQEMHMAKIRDEVLL